VLGVGGGFFVPLFFVVLGARLDLRGVIQRPAMIWLTLALAALAIVVHLVAAVATRQRPAAGLLASAQLGPSAVVALGVPAHVITSTQAAAIIAAAPISLAACSTGAALLARGSDDARSGARSAAGAAA
jgi:Kef-type K+ transport system membrane component KefB